MFYNDKVRAYCTNNKSLNFHSDEKINARFILSLSSFILASGMKTSGHSQQKFKTHEQFGNLIYLSVQSHIISNKTYLAHGLIGSPYGNKTSLYLEAIFYALNFSSDPLINVFELFFKKISRNLHQLLRDSWQVPAWIHVLKPYIIWWCCVIFNSFCGIINLIL